MSSPVVFCGLAYFPLPSKSFVQKVDVGDVKKIEEDLSKTLSRFANVVPGVGHFKGIVHYYQGDKESGDQAMKQSSRSLGVISGGAVGLLVGGMFGAAAGGAVGGVTVDSMTTLIESLVEQKFTPSGSIFLYDKLYKNPEDAAVWFTVFATVVKDALVGGIAGDAISNSNIFIENILCKTISRDQLTKIGMRLALSQPKSIPFGRDATALLSKMSTLLQSPDHKAKL